MAKEWIECLIIGIVCVIVYIIGFYCGYVKDKEEVNKIFNDALRREQEARELCDKAERNLADAQNCLNEARKQNEEMKKELYGNNVLVTCEKDV